MLVSKFNIKLYLLSFVVINFFVASSFAAIAIYEFDDPILEERFNQLIFELRCPKCQNQNLADSNSELSMDLKQIVYEKLNQGESDEQIIAFMKQRYGEFILFKPELNQSNLLLWTGPIIFLIVFIVFFFRWYRKNRVEINE